MAPSCPCACLAPEHACPSGCRPGVLSKCPGVRLLGWLRRGSKQSPQRKEGWSCPWQGTPSWQGGAKSRGPVPRGPGAWRVESRLTEVQGRDLTDALEHAFPRGITPGAVRLSRCCVSSAWITDTQAVSVGIKFHWGQIRGKCLQACLGREEVAEGRRRTLVQRMGCCPGWTRRQGRADAVSS